MSRHLPGRLFVRLLAVAALLALPVMGASCSDTTTSAQPDASDAPVTLADELTAAGLPPGNWLVQAGGNAVCTHTFTYPGAPAPTTQSIDLSGYSTFELVVENEYPAIRGAYDQLAARWTNDQCVEYDASLDAVTNHTACGGDDPCTPFNLVRLCANGGSPTFFARVADCGQNTFPAAAAQ